MSPERVPDLPARERALLAEAMRRVQSDGTQTATETSLAKRAVSGAYVEGRRDLFGLVKAGRNAT